MPIWWSIFSCTRSTDAAPTHVCGPFWSDRPCDDVPRVETGVTISQDLPVVTTTGSFSSPPPFAQSAPTTFRLHVLRGHSKMSFGITRRRDSALMTLFPNRPHIVPSTFNVFCRSDSTRRMKSSRFRSSTPIGTGDRNKDDEDLTIPQRPGSIKTSTLANPNRSSFFEARTESHIPPSVLALFVYLARQGVHVNDLFRRPGNISQMKQILEGFVAGHPIDWDSYNVYTVANVAKKLLLAIPGGLFGPYGEELLLATADSSCSSELDDLKSTFSHPSPSAHPLPTSLDAFKATPIPPSGLKTVSFSGETVIADSVQHSSRSRDSIHQGHLLEVAQKRISVFLRVLNALPPSHQEVAVLMFGILHQLVFHSASNGAKSTLSSMLDLNRPPGMSEMHETQPSGGRRSSNPDIPLLTLAEGVVKSVAGSLFHTCSSSVQKVEQTAQVLRSLVLYFPSMEDSVLHFYIDAVSNRLKPVAGIRSIEAFTDSVPHPVCILCPSSGHSSYFDEGSSAKYERRQCPVNLFHAASRLFCLNGSSSTPLSRKVGSLKHPVQSPFFFKLSSVSAKPRFACPPSSCKIHASPTAAAVGDLFPLQSSDTVTDPPALLTQCAWAEDTFIHRKDMANVHSPGIVSREPQPVPSTVENMNEFNIVEHGSTRCTGTLRRNHSRYKSLRRRQMENLSRRAEWFLGPTVLPAVTFKPSTAYPSATHHCLVDGECASKSDLVVTSTVSLLDLDDSFDRVMRGPNELGLHHLSSVPPPRLLFTASTGELGEPEFATSSKDETTADDYGGSLRQRFPSVGSYLDPTHADSYISLHSAPSCGLNRFEDGDMLPLLYPLRCTPQRLQSVESNQPLQEANTANLDSHSYPLQPPTSVNMLTDRLNSVELKQAVSVHEEQTPFSNYVQKTSFSLLYRPYEDRQPLPVLPFATAENRGPDGRPRRNSALPTLQVSTRPIEDEVMSSERNYANS